MAVIQVLNRHVAELIAAGEVVERPASVIKELMENSIDAGATQITVEIRNGGTTYMRVTDNGCGMKREDVPTAFLRHATSKVRSVSDLTAIETLGFRGEALASISAVARVTLSTCAETDIIGTRYVIHGGDEVSIEDCGCPKGTTIEAEDLFYNIPARMKFLKKDVSEGNAVAGVVERLALSHPEIAFRFIRDGHTDMQTPGDGELRNDIHAVLGKAFVSGLVPVCYEMNGITVKGFICKPEACRQNRTMQHFFVNGRYVKTQTGMVALERAYKGVIMVGRFPTCVLNIELPAETVDANVHPAKIEVRFINEKPVFDAVYYAVKSALESSDRFHYVQLGAQSDATREPHREAPIQQPVRTAPASTTVSRTLPSVHKEEIVRVKAETFLDISADDADKPVEAPIMENHAIGRAEIERTLSHICDNVAPPMPIADVCVSAPQSITADEATEQTLVQTAFLPEKQEVRYIGEVFATYILAQMGESLYIIDKHAAHERMIYNDLRRDARADEQILLAPVSVSVSTEEYMALIENEEVLKQAGIDLEDFGRDTVLVRAFPMILSGCDIEGTIREIASGLTDGCRQIVSAKLDWIYHSSACRAAIKAGDHSTPNELLEIAKRVLEDDDVRYCPHGRPVCIEMSRKELEKQFGRVL